MATAGGESHTDHPDTSGPNKGIINSLFELLSPTSEANKGPQKKRPRNSESPGGESPQTETVADMTLELDDDTPS